MHTTHTHIKAQTCAGEAHECCKAKPSISERESTGRPLRCQFTAVVSIQATHKRGAAAADSLAGMGPKKAVSAPSLIAAVGVSQYTPSGRLPADAVAAQANAASRC